MAKTKRPQQATLPVGRPTLFVPEVRATIVNTLIAGASNKDACAQAGISEETFYEWMRVARSIEGDLPYKNKPNDPDLQREFSEFSEAVKKAKAQQRLRAIANIVKAGQERWIHRRTGQVRTIVPPPITWLNEATGEIVFTDPTGYDAQGKWTRNWSGDVWSYDGGTWQAHAWFVERSDPANWSQKTRHEITLRPDELEGLSDEELALIARGQDK